VTGSTGMVRVIVVPGLAVHAYAELPVQHLRDSGYDARLLQPPAWRGIEHDLERYGRKLATDIDRDGVPVDVLIGLSAGTQAAAVAASLTNLVERVVLVSPTIDPAYRSMIKQSMVFVRGDPHDKAAFFSQVPDWSRAGIPRILRGFASAIDLHLEDILHPRRTRPTHHTRVCLLACRGQRRQARADAGSEPFLAQSGLSQIPAVHR
jgi:pimeloyl-ACP methyl ester carboxylesterase